VRVVRGRDLAEVSEAEVAALAAAHEGLTVDVGTGDGRLAYACARRHPQRLVVGMDPARDQMRETSWRALRKPSRGGLPNVLFVWAGVEAPPAELKGRADRVAVILPWGRLMVGLTLALPDILEGLRALAAPGARFDLVLGADVWQDPVPADLRDLPEVTVDYVESVLVPAYERHGLRIVESRMLAREEIAGLATTWARRLAHGRDEPRFVYVRALAAPS